MAGLLRTAVLLALAATPLAASQRLLYLEAQAVAGYSFPGKEVRWHSMDQMDAMQKPGIGFDLLQRFSGGYGDWGVLAVQARLAYDSTRRYDLEPQLYNAFIKIKPGFYDLWLGHNRPAFGLSSALDNHGTLLQPLSMYGFGYDRDWGAGYYRDHDWGNAAFSATLGSGMPFYARGNYLLSGRLARGDLNRDNRTLALSLSYGRTLETMGYHLVVPDQLEQYLAGVDASWRWNNAESRAELLAGRMRGVPARAAFLRAALSLLPEGRLSLEGQSVYQWVDGIERYQFLAGLSLAVTASITARTAFEFNRPGDDGAAQGQVYWYYKL